MKKITKFLDSVMGGIKRTCVAKALAVFAVASIAINVNAQTTNEQAVITGIDQLTGISQDELLNNAITGTTFPTNDESKQFFLYNVKTGRFLNTGSYWGTHASLKQYGEPIAVIDGGKDKYDDKPQILQLIMEMNGTEGNFVGWCGVPATTGENHPNVGVYVDRNKGDVYGWVLEPTGDDKNTYRLRTYAHSQFDKNKKNIDHTKRYYLCSNKGLVDVDRNCEAYPVESLSQYSGYDEWRFISCKQIRDLQDLNGDNLTDALELSFMLKCPGFSRGDNDIKSWHTYDFATENLDVEKDRFVIYGLQNFNRAVIWPKADDGKNETDFFTNSLPDKGINIFKPKTPYTFDNVDYYNGDLDNYRCNLGKYYCASITNERGIIFQNIEVTHTGTFKFECKGYSTTNKAALFAGVLDPANPNKMVNNSLNRTILNQTSDMLPAVYDKLHISEKNMDYAGQTFYSGNYNNVVFVTVPEETPKNKNGKYTIRVGIMIGDNVDDKTPVTEGVGEWTVFDDFRMQYASRTYNEDLILDEERDNLTYLTKLKPVKNKTMRLRKTFTVNKWNSFILPVNLTKKQVRETFGTDTRLAKLTGLTETGIEFTSVKLSGDNGLALEAYVPYLIFPTKAADQTPAYQAKYEQKDTDTRLWVNIGANHYVIDKVFMPQADGENGLSQMDQNIWTSKTTSNATNGGESIVAYGTFARTFDPDAKQNPKNGEWTYSDKKGIIIEKRDDLKGCYFFANGKMYHSKNDNTYRPRGLRGFSCWFKPGTKQNSVKLTLDGVTQDGTTGIEDILADYEQPVSRFANGIYNLNGQLVKQGNSTAGLPSGMYIVNGKKCIVR